MPTETIFVSGTSPLCCEDNLDTTNGTICTTVHSYSYNKTN